MAKIKTKPFTFSSAEIVFIALMSAANVGFDIIVSPGLILLFSHIIAGIFIMVPVNFLFMSITRLLVNKYGTLTFYLTIFGLISIPTTLFGGVAGPYKILVGLAIGIGLDALFLPKSPWLKIILGSIGGSIIWWVMTFTIWQAFNFPFVTAFSNLVNSTSSQFNGWIALSGFIHLPITKFGPDFFLFAVFCGLLSAVPVFMVSFAALGIYKRIEKTAVYLKFKDMQ